MPMSRPAGFVSGFYDPTKNPSAPTNVSATSGDAQATVSFTAPTGPEAGGSAITAYYAVSNPGQITVSGASSPITVTGLTNDTPYTFNVWALNSYGPGAWSAASGSVTPSSPRAVFGSGEGASTYNNIIDYVVIATTGNATDFGDMSTGRTLKTASCASTSRCFFIGGYSLDVGAYLNVVQYVTFSTTGNSVDFGDTTVLFDSGAGCNSSTRGLASVFYNRTGGFASSNINYITMATTGNASSFGNLTVARYWGASCSSPTRGIFAGGDDGGDSNVIDYVTIASTGNATDFGDLVAGRARLAGCSSSTRGLFGGGVGTAAITYITLASTGNATSFGELLAGTALYELSSCSSETRGLWAGGTSTTNVIQYVTIATTGNALDFGDLTVARRNLSAGCASNGGLQ